MNNDLRELIGEIPRAAEPLNALPCVDDDPSKVKKYQPSERAREHFRSLDLRDMITDIFGEDVRRAHPSDARSGVYDVPSSVIDQFDNERYEDSTPVEECKCACDGCSVGKCETCSATEKCKFCMAGKVLKATKLAKHRAGKDWPGPAGWITAKNNSATWWSQHRCKICS